MQKDVLEQITGEMIINPKFKQDMLSDKKAELISQFPVDDEDRQMLMSIRADSLESFAAQLQAKIHALEASKTTGSGLSE